MSLAVEPSQSSWLGPRSVAGAAVPRLLPGVWPPLTARGLRQGLAGPGPSELPTVEADAGKPPIYPAQKGGAGFISPAGVP